MKQKFDYNELAFKYSPTFADYFAALAKRARRKAAREAKNRAAARTMAAGSAGPQMGSAGRIGTVGWRLKKSQSNSIASAD